MLPLPIPDIMRSLSLSSSNLLPFVEWVCYLQTGQTRAYKSCVACRLPGDVSSPAGFWEMMLSQGS